MGMPKNFILFSNR